MEEGKTGAERASNYNNFDAPIRLGLVCQANFQTVTNLRIHGGRE